MRHQQLNQFDNDYESKQFAKIPVMEIKAKDISSDIISQRLSNYFCSENLSDVTFVVGSDKERLPGHKFILITSSPVFYAVLNHVKLDNNELPIEDVKRVKPSAFKTFLYYIYNGTADFDDDNAFDILKLAQRFEMDHLLEICTSFISSTISSDTCLKIYAKSSSLEQNSQLKMNLLKVISDNFFWLIQNPHQVKIFMSLSLAQVRDIAMIDRLQCEEIELFNVIIKWAIHRCRKHKILGVPKNFRNVLKDVFYLIRFPIMKSDWLIEILAKYPELLTQSEITEISRAKRYEVKSRSKFLHDPRQNYDPFTGFFKHHQLNDGTIVSCFSNPIKTGECISSEMAIKFRCDSKRSLLGFAFIAKKGQKIWKISCKIKRESAVYSSLPNKGVIPALISDRMKLSWDHDIIFVRFVKKPDLSKSHYMWFDFHCKFDKTVPSVWCENFREKQFHNIHMKCSEYNNVVPYLIFD